jgi:hypothetical protein
MADGTAFNDATRKADACAGVQHYNSRLFGACRESWIVMI